jgi:glycosyltransferase involved in cell wall biosynthesis
MDALRGRTRALLPILSKEEASDPSLPSIVFALRFRNDSGVVQKSFAHHRDLAARELQGSARFLLAFRHLGEKSAYPPKWSQEVQIDFYDFSEENRQKISRFVADNRVCLVVFQGASPGEIDTAFFRRLGVNTANTEDSSFDNSARQSIPTQFTKVLQRRVMKRNLHHLYIANSSGQLEFLINYVKLPRSRVKRVGYGIDTDFYRPGDRVAACRRLDLDPEVTWLMAASQSRPEKRIDSLLHAVRRVMDARPDKSIGFFYVGGGAKLQEWRDLAETVLPAHACRFFGLQAEVQPFYQAASLFIHGAERESFGLVLAEAMASGLPVVATKAYGPAEIIEHNHTGFLVDQNDWEGFFNSIVRYVDSAELREAHGQAARQRCVATFPISRVGIELAECLRQLIP